MPGFRALAESAGGQLDRLYDACGEHDVCAIFDPPGNETAAAFAVNASGAIPVRTVVLLPPEEVDAAAQRTVEYRAPGT